MARTYKRDARGRFAGGGGGGSGGGSKKSKSVKLPARKPGGKNRGGGHLLKKQAVKDAKAKLAAKDMADQSLRGTLSRRAQKGAVTRAQNALRAAQQSGRVRMQRKGGVIRVGKGRKSGAPVASRRSARTADQQAQRDNLAKTLKLLPKETRRKLLRKPSAEAKKAEAKRNRSRRINHLASQLAVNTHRGNSLASSLDRLSIHDRNAKLRRIQARIASRSRSL